MTTRPISMVQRVNDRLTAKASKRDDDDFGASTENVTPRGGVLVERLKQSDGFSSERSESLREVGNDTISDADKKFSRRGGSSSDGSTTEPMRGILGYATVQEFANALSACAPIPKCAGRIIVDRPSQQDTDDSVSSTLTIGGHEFILHCSEDLDMLKRAAVLLQFDGYSTDIFNALTGIIVPIIHDDHTVSEDVIGAVADLTQAFRAVKVHSNDPVLWQFRAVSQSGDVIFVDDPLTPEVAQSPLHDAYVQSGLLRRTTTVAQYLSALNVCKMCGLLPAMANKRPCDLTVTKVSSGSYAIRRISNSSTTCGGRVADWILDSFGVTLKHSVLTDILNDPLIQCSRQDSEYRKKVVVAGAMLVKSMLTTAVADCHQHSVAVQNEFVAAQLATARVADVVSRSSLFSVVDNIGVLQHRQRSDLFFQIAYMIWREKPDQLIEFVLAVGYGELFMSSTGLCAYCATNIDVDVSERMTHLREHVDDIQSTFVV